MPYLKQFHWWPTVWLDRTGNAVSAVDVSKNATLKNVRLIDTSLSIEVDYKGLVYSATIIPGLSKDALILLRHILLQYYSEPMEIVEIIDIELQSSFPFVR